MIPLWLTPKVMKLGVIGIIIMAIFFAGWRTKGKIDAGKIQRMQAEVQTLKNNNDLCIADVERSQENYETLRTAIEKASAEALAANESYRLRMTQIKESNRAAIRQLNASHDVSISSMSAESAQLRERMVTLSSAESCHLAMQEIVK
jgi:hypothetical protein